MDYTADSIDPHRPWIRDERDDPRAMNWIQTFFNPMGKTYKLHFSRAWTAMFFGRLMLYIVPALIVGLLGAAGVKAEGLTSPVSLLLFSVPAFLVPFAVFTLVTEYTSFVVHIRRLTEAGRSAFMAVIVLIPLLLGLIFYALGAQGGAATYRQMHEPANTEALETRAGAGGAEEAEEDASGKGDAKAAKGPPNDPRLAAMSQRELAMTMGMGMAFPVWWLASFGAMLWSLLYVARLPNGGQGMLRTGSHMTPEEISRGA